MLSLFGFRFDQPGTVLGVDLTREQLIYLLMLVLMVVMTVIAKNPPEDAWAGPSRPSATVTSPPR